MPINFDNIPGSASTIVPEGLYRAVVEKAEMRPAWDAADPFELNVTMQLFDKTGKSFGRFFETFKDTEKTPHPFKIGRFIKACGLNLTGSVELKDIAKLITGKEVIVDISHYVKPDQSIKVQSNAFGSKGCYAPVTDFEALLGEDGALPTSTTAPGLTVDELLDEDLPFAPPTDNEFQPITDATLPGESPEQSQNPDSSEEY